MRPAARRSSIAAAAALPALLAVFLALPVLAKAPGTTYCYGGICHRVLTLEETAAAVGQPLTLVASYYDVPWRDRFNPSLLTSSGEMLRAEADDSAASPIYPDGTRLLVWEPKTGGALVIRVNNAGPYFSNRLLDLSRGAAERLGLGARGVAAVETMVLSAPMPEEAGYVAGRNYAPVPGYIGVFGTLREAHDAWLSMGGKEIAAQSQERIAALPQTQQSGRVVVIPGRGGGRAGARSRVTLLPVMQRRPAMIRAIAARKAAPARSARR